MSPSTSGVILFDAAHEIIIWHFMITYSCKLILIYSYKKCFINFDIKVNWLCYTTIKSSDRVLQVKETVRWLVLKGAMGRIQESAHKIKRLGEPNLDTGKSQPIRRVDKKEPSEKPHSKYTHFITLTPWRD